jgi:hypothetical protein
MPKSYRNQALLSLAQKIPHCVHCGVKNFGQVTACHSNSQRHGKGMGLKAHDVPAYLCCSCHDLVDGRSEAMLLTRADRDTLFLDCVYKTFLWLLQEGHLKVIT